MAQSSEKSPIAPAKQPLEQEKDSARGQIVSHRAEVSFSGPLPPPGVLAGYEDILPGSADRILTMAEKQLEHRMYLEKKVIDGGDKHATLGIYTAVAIEAMFIAASCYLAHLGQGAAAIEVMGGSVVALLGAFGFGTISRRNERQQKQKRLTEGSTDQGQEAEAKADL